MTKQKIYNKVSESFEDVELSVFLGSKFNRLIGGSVLDGANKKNIGPYPLLMEIESPVDTYFIRERRAYIQSLGDAFVYTRKLHSEVIYPTILDPEKTPPLPRIRELNISGALPYFCLVVGFLLAVGGWFWWFFVR